MESKKIRKCLYVLLNSTESHLSTFIVHVCIRTVVLSVDTVGSYMPMLLHTYVHVHVPALQVYCCGFSMHVYYCGVATE